MINDTVVELSRWQFATTALYHFLFVPLTLGLSFLLAAMETVYVTTGRDIYRRMTQFWGRLFLINFALGVATGLTMEFQFGTNWSYYSSFVGDTFGAAAGARRDDGFLHGGHVRRADGLWLGAAHPRPASDRHLPCRAGIQLVGGVDPDRERLHAGSRRERISIR